MISASPSRWRLDPALLVVLAGVSAALHVGKLPPAIPVLRDALGVSLVQAGFLLSLVQLAGMSLGLLVGVMADDVGLRRTLVSGLLLLAVASGLGATATDAASLMLWRAVEGFGFLLASMPGPALIRRLVDATRLNARLGLWGTYMPLGTALALLCGPLVMSAWGWPVWWWGLAALSALMALAVLWQLPPDPPARVFAAPSMPSSAAPAPPSGPDWQRRLGHTLAHRGPWLVACTFAVYSAQWLAVIGFLPSIYAQAGVPAAQTGVLTAGAAAVNMLGNVVSGRLLQGGLAARQTLTIGFVAMAAGTLLAFGDGGQGPAWRYAGVLLFSAVGGLIPGTLFSTAVRLAPGEHTVSSTVGFMLQLSSLGQFAGPPAVAWIASRAGGWQMTWLVTGALAAIGLALAQVIHAELGRRSLH